MSNFFLILMGFFIVVANVIALNLIEKRKVYTLRLLQYYYQQFYLGQSVVD